MVVRNKETHVNINDDSLKKMLWQRFPPLIAGLLLGILLSFVTSRFEQVLEHDVKVAFFIPFIVYIADAVGTQTENIYVRSLRLGKGIFGKYFIQETLAGIIIGFFSAIAIFLAVFMMYKTGDLAMAVSVATFLTISIAPPVALTVVEILELERADPAVGAGPLATVIQDTISVVVYGLVVSLIML